MSGKKTFLYFLKLNRWIRIGIAIASPATVNKGYKKITVAKISDMNYKKSLNLKG
jgi:hypothetical protein